MGFKRAKQAICSGIKTNPSTQEAETGELLGGQGQPGLNNISHQDCISKGKEEKASNQPSCVCRIS